MSAYHSPEKEEKFVEVTYKFYLPEHDHDLKMFQNAYKYYSALSDIHNECRRVWKYDDKASEELVKFAEEIGAMAVTEDL